MAREPDDLDAAPALRRVHHPSPAEIEADMAEAVEEEEVAGAKVRALYGAADLELGRGTVRQLDAETPVDPARQAGAVEAAGPRTSPDVRRADLAKRDPCGALAERNRLLARTWRPRLALDLDQPRCM